MLTINFQYKKEHTHLRLVTASQQQTVRWTNNRKKFIKPKPLFFPCLFLSSFPSPWYDWLTRVQINSPCCPPPPPPPPTLAVIPRSPTPPSPCNRPALKLRLLVVPRGGAILQDRKLSFELGEGIFMENKVRSYKIYRFFFFFHFSHYSCWFWSRHTHRLAGLPSRPSFELDRGAKIKLLLRLFQNPHSWNLTAWARSSSAKEGKCFI